MANSIVIDLQVTGLSSFGNSLKTAGKQISSFNNGSNQIGPGMQRATAAVRNFAQVNNKAQQQYQRLVQSSWRASGKSSGMAGFGGIGMLGKFAEIYAAIRLLRMAFEGAAAAAKSFQQSMYGAVGVTPGQASALDIGGKFSGVGAADWQAIHDKIRGGGVAASELTKHNPGFHPRPGPYGDLNPAPTAEEAIRFLRDPKVSQASKDRFLSETDPRLRAYEYLTEDEYQKQKAMGFGFGPQQATDVQSKESRFEKGYETATSMFHPKAWAMSAGEVISKALAWLNHGTSTQFGPSGQSSSQASPAEKLTNAIDSNTQAVRENSAVIKNGTGIGGGTNAGHMPTAAYVHQLLQSENNRQALQMGAYRL